jgi:hypothetical protein
MPNRNQPLLDLNVMPILQVFVIIYKSIPPSTARHPPSHFRNHSIPFDMQTTEDLFALPLFMFRIQRADNIHAPRPLLPAFPSHALDTKYEPSSPISSSIYHPSLSFLDPQAVYIPQSKKERCETYLATTTQFLHRAPNLHPPHLLRDTLLYFHVCTIIPCSR